MSSKTATILATCETADSPQHTEKENLKTVSPDCAVEPKKTQEEEESEETTEDEEEFGETAEDEETTDTEDEDEAAPANKKIKLKESSFNIQTGKYLVKKRAMMPPLTPIVSTLYFDGTLYRVGDVVAIMDAEENIFYAQIIGLLINEHCKRRAVIRWLLPTSASPNPKERFDPETYYLGPKENITRGLAYLQVVDHKPLGYFKSHSVRPGDMADSFRSEAAKFVYSLLPER